LGPIILRKLDKHAIVSVSYFLTANPKTVNEDFSMAIKQLRCRERAVMLTRCQPWIVEEIRELAKQNGVSMNRLTVAILRRFLKQRRKRLKT
jgi:hypothetical protein